MTLQDDSAFEQVIGVVGNDGPFQKRFNILFNFILVILASMPYLNIVIALAIPEHWCNVPGRELTNFSIEAWKDMHIPRENDTRGKHSHSKCRMYNSTDEYERAIVDCQYGWEFDKTWYDVTAPSQEEWVCDKRLHVTNALVFTRIGEVIGTFAFGQLADAIGRRPVFYMTVVTILIGRVLSTATAQWLPVFFLAAFIGNLPSTSVFQGPLVIAMEISKNEDRAHIAMLQCIGWTIGLCVMPFVMWIVRDWVSFMLITTLPCALFLFSQQYLIESPRWLASKGKIKRCLDELEKISIMNHSKVPEDAGLLLSKSAHSHEKSYGAISLFSSWRLAKNSVLLVGGWSITILIYYFLTLNISNLGGNPFMNFFWQGLSELPAYIIGKYASDRYGRRCTNIGAFLGTALGCLPLIYLIQDEKYTVYVGVICIFLKFCISFAFFVVNLQSLEIYPTCIRQTGISLGGIMGNAVGIIGPYLVYVGTNINATYPFIICAILSAVGTLTGFLLPETFNHKLPETLADASIFGADQNMWGKVVEEKIIHVEDSEKPLRKNN